jgi:hypothetical protein
MACSTASPTRSASRSGRCCHSTLPLTAIGCHCLGIHTLILLSLLSLSATMIVPPWATYVQVNPGYFASTSILGTDLPLEQWRPQPPGGKVFYALSCIIISLWNSCKTIAGSLDGIVRIASGSRSHE